MAVNVLKIVAFAILYVIAIVTCGTGMGVWYLIGRNKYREWKERRHPFTGVAVAFTAAEEAAERANQHSECVDDPEIVEDDIDVLILGIDGHKVAYHYPRPWCLVKELAMDDRVVSFTAAQITNMPEAPDDTSEL